jgi:opacity protein-like surface antigen
MKKFILALALTIISSICAVAQSDDYQKKPEFYAGYSYGQADASFGNRSVYKDRTPLDGFNAAAVFPVSRYVGIKGDVSGAYKNVTLTLPTLSLTGIPISTTVYTAKNSIYNVLGGVQVKDYASTKRLKPFAHALAGAGFRKNELTPGGGCITTIICPGSSSDTGLAMAFGGGLDVRVNKRVDIRAFQVDYNPIRFNGKFDNNFRLGIGIVFK